MIRRIVISLVWLTLLALALWLRIEGLEVRPIHFDEATGARLFADRLENANYRFDPTHFHGPLLSMSTVPLARLYNQQTWQELSVIMLRTGPVLAGLLMVLTPLLWLRIIGHAAALASAALLATSPLLVYYNRMYIHESWLALFGMLAAAAIFHLIQSPTRLRAVLAGVAVGLMFATKETVAISVIAWGVAGWFSWMLLRYRPEPRDKPPPPLLSYGKPAIWFLIATLLSSALFYTEGFTRPGGMIEAFRTYFVYETTPGHDKAFSYYLQLLVLPKHALGIWWTEGGILGFALLACVLAAWRQRQVAALSFIAIGCLLHCLIYSWISYKTPWLMTLPWALACLLAGYVFLNQKSRRSLVQSTFLYGSFGLCLFYQYHQSTHANGRLSNHEHNPYAYVPTSKNMEELPRWLRDLDHFPDSPGIEPIAVIGRSYWPLPWYLRDFETIGYWPEPPENLADFPIVLSMPEQTAACNTLLMNSHINLPRTLRSNVPITLHLKNEIWEAWTKPNQ